MSTCQLRRGPKFYIWCADLHMHTLINRTGVSTFFLLWNRGWVRGLEKNFLKVSQSEKTSCNSR